MPRAALLTSLLRVPFLGQTILEGKNSQPYFRDTETGPNTTVFTQAEGPIHKYTYRMRHKNPSEPGSGGAHI